MLGNRHRFKVVPEFPNYKINHFGDVKNQHGRILKCGYNRRTGYNFHILYNKKGKKNWEVHKIMRNTYLNNPYGLEHTDHKDRDKKNNCLYNLRLVSRSQNQQNRAINKNNSSGYKNISKRGGSYLFTKNLEGVRIRKSFTTLLEAVEYKLNYLRSRGLPLY